MADINMFTTPFQLTKSMHRDVYPAVDPANPALSAKDKVIIITGAGGGLGAVSTSMLLQLPSLDSDTYYCARQSRELGHRLVLPVSFSLDARLRLSLSPLIKLRRLMSQSLSWLSPPMYPINRASIHSSPKSRPNSAKLMSWSTLQERWHRASLVMFRWNLGGALM